MINKNSMLLTQKVDFYINNKIINVLATYHKLVIEYYVILY